MSWYVPEHLTNHPLFSEEEEVFQVKKSSQSKKLMRQLDKERRRKAKGIGTGNDSGSQSSNSKSLGSELSNKSPPHGGLSASTGTDSANGASVARDNITDQKIQIRTDDNIVVRLLLSNT